MKNEKSIWDRLKSGDISNRMKSGYLILGPNSADGSLSDWHCDCLDGPLGAITLATSFAKITGSCYEIMKYDFVGIVRPVETPIEFVQYKEGTEFKETVK